MEMTKDAIALIQETAQRAATAQVVKIDGDPDHVLISQGGLKEFRELPPKHRNHTAKDLDSLLDLADHKCAFGEDAKPNSIIWHSEEAIVVVLDDETRRDFATMALTYSTAYAALRALATGKTYDQRSFVRLLRTSLADCVPPDLIASIQRLKFSKSESGESNIEHGQSTLGRQVEKSVTGASNIPESFVVQTSVYSNVLQDQTVDVRVAIDIDLEEHNFTLSIIGDDLSKSMLETQEALSERLAEGNDQRRVLFGKP